MKKLVDSFQSQAIQSQNISPNYGRYLINLP